MNSDPVPGILSSFECKQENLLPILHAVQEVLGHIPSDRVEVIARALNISRAEVHGVITFYHHFRSTPIAQRHLQICKAEACQSMGANDLFDHALRRCGSKSDAQGASVTLDAVYCLGLCAMSPALMMDGTPHGRVTTDALDKLLDLGR